MLPIVSYRKRPVVIQAVLADLDKKHRIPDEFQSQMCNCDNVEGGYEPEPGRMVYPWHIHTLEGSMVISDGDYIIKGVNGEFYPCKPDIFRKSYEEVELGA